jgi:hypothetical protein
MNNSRELYRITGKCKKSLGRQDLCKFQISSARHISMFGFSQKWSY